MPALTITAHVQDPDKKIEITADGESSGTVLLDMEDSSGKLLSYRTVPDQAAVTDVIWSTNDKAVAIMEHEDGTATILPSAPGKAEIQLSAVVNGGLRKTACTVYVLTTPDVTLKADETEADHIFLVPQGTANLEAIADDGYPAELNAETTFAWKSSDETVATVSNAARTASHRTVGAATPGNAAVTVKVTTELPGVSDSQNTAEKTIDIEAEDIKLTGLVIPQDFTLKKGKTGTVSYGNLQTVKS